jgi:hypothetical protein
MWCPIQPPDARHLGNTHGDTEGDTHGDSVSPRCIPHLACNFLSKYKTLADRSATRINPDLPLGAPPSGSQSPSPCRIPFSDGSLFPLRSRHIIVAFSQMDVVASLGALLRWRRFFWPCILAAVPREAVGTGRTWSTILPSPFLNSCKRFCFSKLLGIFGLRFFHLDDFGFSFFDFLVIFEKPFRRKRAPRDMANTICT